LWKKIGKRWLSAGRVQTVALRFIVEREKEIEKFASEPFYKVNGIFTPDKKEEIEAKLVSYKDIPYEKKLTIELFDGKYTYSKTSISADQIDQIKSDLENDSFLVDDIAETVTKRTPPPPFITSTLQQEASHKIGYSSKLTMKLAQNLGDIVTESVR
jgi:DNA topoisomerase-1